MAERMKIQIFGQTYYMQGDLDTAYVEDLAKYVDAKMATVAEETHTVDSVRVAVLAALSIADELHTLRRNQQDMKGALRDRTERCLNLVERALKQTA
jgi:cell division protein ZapA